MVLQFFNHFLAGIGICDGFGSFEKFGLVGMTHHVAENPAKVVETGWTSAQNGGGQGVFLDKSLYLTFGTAERDLLGFGMFGDQVRTDLIEEVKKLRIG